MTPQEEYLQTQQMQEGIGRAARMMRVHENEMARYGFAADGYPLSGDRVTARPGATAGAGSPMSNPGAVRPRPQQTALPLGKKVEGYPNVYEAVPTTPKLNDPMSAPVSRSKVVLSNRGGEQPAAAPAPASPTPTPAVQTIATKPAAAPVTAPVQSVAAANPTAAPNPAAAAKPAPAVGELGGMVGLAQRSLDAAPAFFRRAGEIPSDIDRALGAFGKGVMTGDFSVPKVGGLETLGEVVGEMADLSPATPDDRGWQPSALPATAAVQRAPSMDMPRMRSMAEGAQTATVPDYVRNTLPIAGPPKARDTGMAGYTWSPDSGLPRPGWARPDKAVFVPPDPLKRQYQAISDRFNPFAPKPRQGRRRTTTVLPE